MKTIITFVFFFFFLLIRSGNSHEVINHSDRPAISFMENFPGSLNQTQQHEFQRVRYTQTNSNGLGGHAEHILLEQDSEDFQLWKDYHLQMAFFSCLIAFSFLLFFPKKTHQKSTDIIIDNNPNPIFISLRTLRI